MTAQTGTQALKKISSRARKSEKLITSVTSFYCELTGQYKIEVR
jgi:hypothetical protein